MIKCLLSRPGLIAGPLHSKPLQNNSQSIPRLDPIDSKSSLSFPRKILETGSRVAKGLEFSWKSWTNIGVLIAFLQEVAQYNIHKEDIDFNQTNVQNEIIVQNLIFLKQVVPSDPKMFMYCILVNMRLTGDEDETKVLAGLQKLRGSVVAGYTALYTVLGEIGRTRFAVTFLDPEDL